MAPPLAADNFGQRQAITTAIKNICQYYPPNTCLRELLQNADDAGATEIEYLLDTRTYNGDPLLSDGLKGFQGPALLARNNSVFRDEDFNSLSSVGDSVKAKDPASTGKFGQGFNAVYHWTDGPWIYSRNWLLLLDPHEWWSRPTGQAGGPRWDVVANQESIEIQNHLQTFSQFNLSTTQPLHQTVIRIPLRTAAQASQSKLFQRKVEPQEIQEALKEFGQEIKEGELLFLKHVRKVIIRTNSEVIFNAEIIDTNNHDSRMREELPDDFKRLYANVSPQVSQDVSRYFELAVHCKDREKSEPYHYAVQHLMLRSSGDVDMDAWARDQKLFPWVAVAAPLQDRSESESFHGRLFTTLRLPMSTNLPLNVHGLFSIAPDRGRLSFTRGANDLPTRWNSFMFTHCIARAWLQLLEHRSTSSWQEEMFAFWPRPNSNPVEMWDNLDDNVIGLAISHNSKVWNTLDGRCVEFINAFFEIEDDHAAKYRSALAQAHVSAVYLEKSFLLKIGECLKVNLKDMPLLNSKVVRQFLRTEGLPRLPEEIVALILEFCLLDAMTPELDSSSKESVFKDLYGIPLWPIVKGGYVVYDNKDLLLPRHEGEMRLFGGSRAASTLDISKLRPVVRGLFYEEIRNLTTVMRHRRLDDLAIDWPNIYSIAPGQTSGDWTIRAPGLDKRLGEIWAWISGRIKGNQKMSTERCRDLWLVPMNACRLRKYQPGSKSPPILLIEKHEHLFQILLNLVSQDIQIAPPLVDTNILGPETISLFRNDIPMRLEMNCTNAGHLDGFVGWLVEGRASLSKLSGSDKTSLLEHLEKLTADHLLPKGMSSSLQTQIRRLPIFSKISCARPFKEHHYVNCSLDGTDHLYPAPADLPPLPNILGASFFRLNSGAGKSLVKRLKALEIVHDHDLLMRHFLPWMEAVPEDVGGELITVNEALIDWLVRRSLPHNDTWQRDIFSRSIIPLPVRDGKRRYRSIDRMIDPSSQLAKLYDAEEERLPCPDFFARHKETLLAYGLHSKLTSSLLLDRAKYISQRPDDVDACKVETLLKLTAPAKSSISDTSLAEIRELKWLPGASVGGQLALFAPNDCRGADESPLVDMVLGTTLLVVKPRWREILGWNERIDITVLLQQLDRCLSTKQYQKVDLVLSQIRPEHPSLLASRSCILGRSGQYFPPSKVFLPGSQLNSRPLAPYLDEVDAKFARDHQSLLEALGLKAEPTVKDLVDVQTSLETEGLRLSPRNVGTAVSVLEIAMGLDFDPVDLLIPDTSSKLRKMKEIVHGEPLSIGDKAGFNFTHPEISVSLANRLGVEQSLARAIRLAIDIDDEDDEVDYTPSESLETNIADTLERYQVTDTFNEFLANADDAGATKVTWILDECDNGPYATSSLLTAELKPFQGPALLVHNDGVFSQKDFDGFKDIGQGGKKGDAASTGMFGRGALSMYHFTDVPMLVSSDSFLILDPQQQVLSIDYKRRRKRRVGTKMLLSAVNRLAPDQLAPFSGLEGFDPDADRYHGTMFRFPLRKIGAQTTLKETSSVMDATVVGSLLNAYLTVARKALLFLRNVSSIEFRIRGHNIAQWNVSASRSGDVDNDTFQRVEITTNQIGLKSLKDIWCVGLEKIEQIPEDVVRTGRGSGKLTECGVAACLVKGQLYNTEAQDHGDAPNRDPSTIVRLAQQAAIQQTVFCRLPTTHDSALPISFHASFAVTGDRRNIALEASAENSGWNRWLLQNGVAELYLETVQFLAPRIGRRAFEFWPTHADSATLSDILSQAFWDKLASQHYKVHDLLPLVTQDVQPFKKNGVPILEATQKTTALTTATFDFLVLSVSRILSPLLAQMIPLLVRPPDRLQSYFRHPTLNSRCKKVDAECLSETFRKEENCKILEDLISQTADPKKQTGILKSLLNAMILSLKGTPMALSALDTCRILPRPCLNDPMGTLYWNPDSNAPLHFVATAEEEELFGFAAESMVHNRLFAESHEIVILGTPSQNPIDILLESNFNIRRLQLSDIGSLLARPKSPTSPHNVTQDLDSWLPIFWKYLNRQFPVTYDASNETADDLLSRAALLDHRIYRIGSRQGWSYITPREFSSQPCVLRPYDKQHQKICEVIPGLSMIDPDCAPFLLNEREGDLKCSKSFKRLLRAFEKIEKTTGRRPDTSIGYISDSETKDVISDIVLAYVQSSEYDVYIDGVTLQQLPIWRRLKSSPSPPCEHIASSDALFCGHEKMLMPWVKNLSRFVDPKLVNSHGNALKKLEVSSLTHQETWDVVKWDLPNDVKSPVLKKQYREFIDFIRRWEIKISGRVAPNGDGIMCETNSLYDHQDSIFMAAFREQFKARFLDEEMQAPSLRNLWLGLGLRKRSSGEVKHGYFLECAVAISLRWNPGSTSTSFSEDSATVASYLKYDAGHFQSWPASTWAALASIPMFKVKRVDDNESSYRVNRIQQIAWEKTHRALNESSDITHKRIMWSQTAFLENQPCDFVYKSLPSSGQPAVSEVFNNLQFLVARIGSIDQGDVPEFLRDVQACYQYLQDKLEHSKLTPGIQKARVWLNLDTTQVELVLQDQLQTNLTSASLLCLNSPIDPLPIKVAKRFLVPYEKLLQGLGCKTVVQPAAVSTPQSSDSREYSLAAEMAVMRRLRDEDKLVDVYFMAEGQKQPAHKIVLAAVSEYCQLQFAGPWGRMSENPATVHIEEMTFLTLSQMVDFAYTGEFEWPELKCADDGDEIGKNLTMLMDLLVGTDRWLFHRLHDMTENFLTSPPYSGIYVRPDTVDDVKEQAESAQARKLVTYCEDFLRHNEDIVVAVRDKTPAE